MFHTFFKFASPLDSCIVPISIVCSVAQLVQTLTWVCTCSTGAQLNWILKTLLNILLRFLLSFTGCPTVLQNSIEYSIEFSISYWNEPLDAHVLDGPSIFSSWWVSLIPLIPWVHHRTRPIDPFLRVFTSAGRHLHLPPDSPMHWVTDLAALFIT